MTEETNQVHPKLPPCFKLRPDCLKLEGMSWLRVFMACQSLMAPTKAYVVTHTRCREVIRQELGFCPKGKPGVDKGHGWRGGGIEAIYEWLGIEEFQTTYENGVVTKDDCTLIRFKEGTLP